MAEIPLPIFYDRSADESGIADQVGARLIDGYVDVVGGKPIIRKRYGLRSMTNLATAAAVDGIYWWDANSVAMAISSGSIHKITSADGNFSDVTGDALSSVTHTKFANNGTYVVMASGGRMVTYNNSGTTAFMADADAPTTVTHLAYLDGYILALEADTARVWYPPDPTDITAWSSTGFFSAETKPDDLVAMDIAYREVTLFGKESTEVFYNDGVTPFSRLEGAIQEMGCIAANSVVNAGGAWMWLNDERRVVLLEGRTPKVVSGSYDEVLRDIAPVSDSYANFISIGKHAYYVISFPGEDSTYAYDLTTGTWAEWGYYDSSAGTYGMWLGRSYDYARRWEQHLVGSRADGNIYLLEPTTFQDGGNTIRTLIRTGQVSHGTSAWKRSKELRIKCKRGLGSETGSEPVFTVRWRDEMGPWSNEIQVSLGKVGETESIVRLFRLGRYRTRQYEIVHSDNTDFQLSGIEEDVEVV